MVTQLPLNSVLIGDQNTPRTWWTFILYTNGHNLNKPVHLYSFCSDVINYLAERNDQEKLAYILELNTVDAKYDVFTFISEQVKELHQKALKEKWAPASSNAILDSLLYLYKILFRLLLEEKQSRSFLPPQKYKLFKQLFLASLAFPNKFDTLTTADRTKLHSELKITGHELADLVTKIQQTPSNSLELTAPKNL